MNTDPETREVLQKIRQGRFVHGVTCVHCEGRCIQRWGGFSGRQRYRCGTCARTFSDLTGTPAQHLKKIRLLPAYAERMSDGESVRRTGRHLGINKDTALRWRHRLLRHAPEFTELATDGLRGITEVTDVAYRCIRTPRTDWDGDETPRRQRVIVMRDRHGLTWHQRSGSGQVSSLTFDRALSVVQSGSTIVTRNGRLGALAFAVRRGFDRGRILDFAVARVNHPGASDLYNTRGVAAFVRREERWLRRFRGVSIQWVQNYLFWFAMVDPVTRTPGWALLLNWPIDVEGPRPERQQDSGTDRSESGEDIAPRRSEAATTVAQPHPAALTAAP